MPAATTSLLLVTVTVVFMGADLSAPSETVNSSIVARRVSGEIGGFAEPGNNCLAALGLLSRRQ